MKLLQTTQKIFVMIFLIFLERAPIKGTMHYLLEMTCVMEHSQNCGQLWTVMGEREIWYITFFSLWFRFGRSLRTGWRLPFQSPWSCWRATPRGLASCPGIPLLATSSSAQVTFDWALWDDPVPSNWNICLGNCLPLVHCAQLNSKSDLLSQGSASVALLCVTGTA